MEKRAHFFHLESFFSLFYCIITETSKELHKS